MPCIDHEFKNCPAYMKLADGEHCSQLGCQRQKPISGISAAADESQAADLEPIVIAGKTGGRQGTI